MKQTAATQSYQKKPTVTPAVSGVLQRKCACGNHTIAGGECAECGKKKRFGLQTKLMVNEPGDIYEQEAERVTNQVMTTSMHSDAGGPIPLIHRFSAESNGQMGVETPNSVYKALALSGDPLEAPLRQDMERRFGHDFARVRVHSGDVAGQSARDVNARAYTVGKNIVFGAGQYAPGTHEGRRLIAHELTHVLQQSNGPVTVTHIQKKPAPEQ
ncbi:MAG TPA: DUF4157 domain-containing protein, partial [Syntrophales bacterium]|nr:DUF4157 domain-containing protein [Syntrophales bacterium]